MYQKMKTFTPITTLFCFETAQYRLVSGGAIERFNLLGVSILDPLLGTQLGFLVPANTKQNGDSVSFPPLSDTLKTLSNDIYSLLNNLY